MPPTRLCQHHSIRGTLYNPMSFFQMAELSQTMQYLGVTVVKVASMKFLGHLPAWFGPSSKERRIFRKKKDFHFLFLFIDFLLLLYVRRNFFCCSLKGLLFTWSQMNVSTHRSLASYVQIDNHYPAQWVPAGTRAKQKIVSYIYS